MLMACLKGVSQVLARRPLKRGASTNIKTARYPAQASPFKPTTTPSVISNPTSPLVCIRGGLDFSHNYFLNHTILKSACSIPLIFYNQIGSGLSTRLPENSKN